MAISMVVWKVVSWAETMDAMKVDKLDADEVELLVFQMALSMVLTLAV